MRLSERSYPHPVVGNRDDVPGAAFQAAILASSDKENFYIDVRVTCSSEEVCSLIREKRATYVAHVECSNTLYRQAFRFHEDSHQITIPGNRLFDKFEVNVMACVLADVPGYSVAGAHPDYGSATFDLSEGDIIAVTDGEEFLAEFEDSLSKVGSIMQVDESQVDDDGIMKVEWNGSRIVIILSKKDFSTYNILKGLEPIGATLASTIVLPVLVQALNAVRDDESDLVGCRWYGVLQRRITKLGISGSDFDALEVAQELLEMPIRRALASARSLQEGE
jgi:hypothetical protein